MTNTNTRFLLASALALLVADSAVTAEQKYTISQTGNIVHIKGPDGFKEVYIGDPTFGQLSAYEFEVVLANAEQPPLPPEEEKADEKDEKDIKSAEEKTDEPTSDADIAALLARANQLYNQKKFLESEKVVNQALNLRPDSAKAHAMLGSLKNIMGDREAAKKEWQKALELGSTDNKLNTQLKSQLPRAE